MKTPLHSQGLDTVPFSSPSLSFPTSPISCFLGLLLLLEKFRIKPSSLFALILSQTRISVPHASIPATIFEHPSLPPLGAHKSIPPQSFQECLSYILLSFAYLDDESQRFALPYQFKPTFLILPFSVLYQLSSKYLSNLFLGLLQPGSSHLARFTSHYSTNSCPPPHTQFPSM